MKTFPNQIMEKLILEKVKFEYGMMISPEIIANLTVEQIVDLETKVARTFFRTFIPGREVRKETIKNIIVYQSWWDHFKATHFSGWLKVRFPVKCKYEPVEIRHYHLCPHTGLPLRSGQREFEIVHFDFLKGEEPEDMDEPLY